MNIVANQNCSEMKPSFASEPFASEDQESGIPTPAPNPAPTPLPIPQPMPNPRGPTYYVGKQGSDTNSCAKAKSSLQTDRKLTIAGGLSCTEGKAANTVIVGDGVYDEVLSQANFKSGTTWDNAILLKSEIPHGAIVRPGPSRRAAFDLDWTSPPGETGRLAYVIVQDFDIDGSAMPNNIDSDGTGVRGLIKVWGNCTLGWVNHIRFQGNKIHDYKSSGNNGSTVNTSGDNCDPNANFLEFIDNELFNNGTSNQFSNTFYIQTGYNIFRGNKIHDSIGDGIRFSQQNSGWPSHNIAEGNDCNLLTRSCVGLNGGHATRNIITRNVGTGSSLDYCIEGSTSDPTNNEIYNNTCVGNAGGIIMTGTGNLIKNNIFYANNTDTVIGVGNTASNNLTIDPLFEDLSKRNFKLKVGSPAIDAGVDIGQPFKGVAPDIGALEY